MNLSPMAIASARSYFKGKQYTANEFTAYQRGYINSYRATYAKAKMEQNSSATLVVASRSTN
jgi:hypothetical protein